MGIPLCSGCSDVQWRVILLRIYSVPLQWGSVEVGFGIHLVSCSTNINGLDHVLLAWPDPNIYHEMQMSQDNPIEISHCLARANPSVARLCAWLELSLSSFMCDRHFK